MAGAGHRRQRGPVGQERRLRAGERADAGRGAETRRRAHRVLADRFAGIEKILGRPAAAGPLLRQAYATADVETKRLAAAIALVLVGDNTHLGDVVEAVRAADGRKGFAPYFESKGPNMVEDSRGLGGAGGVWAILREGVKNEQYDEVVAWLANAFRLTPEQVLHEPTATEIESMVFLLVKAGCVSGLGGSFGSRDAWVEYVSQLGL